MRLRTFCSISIIPTLILILLLLSSVDNYMPENQVYGQPPISDELQTFNLNPIVSELSNFQTSKYSTSSLIG